MKYIEIAKKHSKRVLLSVLCVAMITIGVTFAPSVNIYAEENTTAATEEVTSEAEEIETEEPTSEAEEVETEETISEEEEIETEEPTSEEEEIETEETTSEAEEVETEEPTSEEEEVTEESTSSENEIALQASKAITFDYNAYPYGVISDSTITLNTVVKKGVPETIEWYYSDSKDGSYTLIEGADELSYQFTAEEGTAYWYKCSVNGYETEAVQVIYTSPYGDVSNNQIKVYSQGGNSAWYISNGTMAYTAGEYSNFDVVGTYTYAGSNVEGSGDSSLIGQTIWISTSYSGGWKTDGIKLMICTFSPDEPHAVLCTAVLDDSTTSFGIYADVCLGASSLFGSLADSASLKAIISDGKATQIQMVGADTVDDAKVTDPAFVLQCTDTPTSFFMGSYSQSRYKYYDYNTSTTGSGVKAYESIDGRDVVTEVAGIDSGFAMGWTGVAAGGTVRFNFNIGSVEQTGAQIKANSQVTSTTVTVTQEEGEIGSILFRLYDKTTGSYTDWVTPDENGKAVFKDLTPNHTYEIQAKKIDDTDDNAESMGDTTTAIDPLKPGSGSAGGEETPEVEVNVTYNSISFKNLGSDYQYRLLDEDGDAATRWMSPSGDDGSIIFDGLYPGKKYYLVAKTSDNSETDKIEYTTSVMVLHYDANTTDEVNNLPEDQTFSSGNVLSSLIPERTGYDFLGWNLEDDKDSDVAYYKAGEQVEDVNEPTLYACWRLKTFSVNISTSEHYDILRDSDAAGYGLDYTFKIVVASDYVLKNVQLTVNGTALADDCVVYDADSRTYTCTIKNVVEEKNVTITYDYLTGIDVAKENAKADVERAADEAKAKIDEMTDLSPEEAEVAKAQVDRWKEDAYNSIEASTDIEQIESTKNAGIENITVEEKTAAELDFDNAKEAALSELDANKAAAEEAVNALTDLTPEEKEAALADIERKYNDAKSAITAVTDYTNKSDIASARLSGSDNMSETKKDAENTDLEHAKDNAKAEIDRMADEAKKLIDSYDNITQEEKDAAKKDIDERAELLKDSINTVTDVTYKGRISEISLDGIKKIEGKREEMAELSSKRNEDNKKSDDDTQEPAEDVKPELKYDEVKDTQVSGESNLVYGNGQINVLIESKNENTDRADKAIKSVFVSSYENIIEACLDADEQRSVADGKKIDIRLIVTSLESVPAQDKTSIEKKTQELAESIPGIEIGGYIDLNLEKRIGSEEWQKIAETNEEIEITINIPEELRRSGVVYSIMRCHDGECTLLADLDDNPDTITIKTGKFSTYAILYSEQAPNVEAPRTGYTSDNYLWFVAAAMAVVAAAIMGVEFTRRKLSK